MLESMKRQYEKEAAIKHAHVPDSNIGDTNNRVASPIAIQVNMIAEATASAHGEIDLIVGMLSQICSKDPVPGEEECKQSRPMLCELECNLSMQHSEIVRLRNRLAELRSSLQIWQ